MMTNHNVVHANARRCRLWSTGLAGSLLGVSLMSCGGTDSIVGPPTMAAVVASVVLTLNSDALRVGETTQAVATVRDSAGNVLSGRVAKFASSNSAVATVAPTGLVTAVGQGAATIIATIGGKTATAPLAVSPGPVASLTLTPLKATIMAGHTVQLTAKAEDAVGWNLPDATLTFSSSNPAVATVSASGLVTAVAQGSAFIVGTSEGKSAYSAVTVIEATTGNWVRFDSDAGDWIGAGNTYAYTAANSTIWFSAVGVHLAVAVGSKESWSGDIYLPQRLGRVAVGTYPNLRGPSSIDPASGGMQWSSENRGCNTVAGSVTIDSVFYSADEQLAGIDLHFGQHCEGGAPALRGTVHWRTSRPPPIPPGPIVPIPTGLWAPPADVVPSSGNWVYFQSDDGDWVGQGQTYLYVAPNAEIDVITDNSSLSEAHATIGVFQENDEWYGNFQGGSALHELQVGYYPNVARYPFHDKLRGGLDWSGNHNGCNNLYGWFVIDAISYVNGKLTALDARFEQHCEGAAPALRGAIHWHA